MENEQHDHEVHEAHGRTLDYADAILTHLKKNAVATKEELVELIHNKHREDFVTDQEGADGQASAMHKCREAVGHAKAYLTRHNQTVAVGDLVCIEPTCYGNLSTIGDVCRSDDAKTIIEKLLAFAQHSKGQAPNHSQDR